MNAGYRYAMTCIVAVVISSAEPPNASDQSPKKAAAGLLGMETGPSLARSYHELFVKASDDQLRTFLTQTDHGVALAAGWERVRRTIPTGTNKRDVKPKKAALSRFLGLVEGRLQAPLPPDWEAAVLSASSTGREHIRFDSPPGDMSKKIIVHGDNVETYGHADVRQDGERCLVLIGNSTWSLPSPHAPQRVLVELTRQAAYILLYDWCLSSCQLCAVERDSGAVRWEAEVWASDLFMNSGGPDRHNVEMQIRDDKVIVFGLSAYTAYIEAFDAKTGKNLCRFGTLYFEYSDE